MMALASFSQNANLYTVMFSDLPGYARNCFQSMQQRDGDIVINTYLLEEIGNNEAIPLGPLFYKVSPTTFSVTDSLFQADTTIFYYLWARDPNGGGNIRGTFEYNEESDSTFLRISHFPDDNLNTNPEEDIFIPMGEGYIWGHLYPFVDCRGDLIMKYYKYHSDSHESADEYIVRIGSDGTLKHQALLSEDCDFFVHPYRLFNESPLQYYEWRGEIMQNLSFILMDSLFNKNTVMLNKMLRETNIGPNMFEHEYLMFSSDTEVIPIGENEILVAAQYVHDTNFLYQHSECGVAVAKYDIRTMQMKGYVVFNDYPGSYTQGDVMGFKRMTDGSVYLVFREYPYPDESVIIVKMDANLNVEWKRFCKTSDIFVSWPLYRPMLYEDGQGEEQGIVWFGYGSKTIHGHCGLVYFFLNHDGIPASVDGGIEVRPYTFYPNPAQDQLHLQYSPDVHPKQIELYDLQGRLLRTQGNAFESFGFGTLPAGTYTLRVTMENGQVFSDKVVKE